jgi:hypothetical protein
LDQSLPGTLGRGAQKTNQNFSLIRSTNTRLEARELAWRRQNAREAWQRARAEAND